MHFARSRHESGFTLVELLVVILIIGILAAIAIPAFLNQRGKASDAVGKETARTGSQAAETYATDHNGSYTGLSTEVLRQYEPALQLVPANNNAWLSVAEAKEEGQGYVVTAIAPTTKDTFTITKNEKGAISRTCKAASESNKSGCTTGTW